MGDLPLRLGVGLLPVLALLAALIYLDSYKLVPFRTVAALMLLGGGVAGTCYGIHTAVLQHSTISPPALIRYVAPITEELGKAAVLVFLIRRSQIGFLVDAAISGFAIGTGFALVENVYFLGLLPSSNPAIWMARGLGTALLHGGATAIVGMVSIALSEGERWRGGTKYLPGLALAVGIHSLFNHFFLSPVASAIGILLVLPPLLYAVFQRSEHALRRWLDLGFDADAELLRLIHSGEFSDSRVGRYLQGLKDRFRGEVVADLLCYLRLRVELALRAKGLLMMREAGFRATVDPATLAAFQEIEYLERSIGRTGCLALSPFLRMSGKELWQLYMLRR